jgi:hypothetical protein
MRENRVGQQHGADQWPVERWKRREPQHRAHPSVWKRDPDRANDDGRCDEGGARVALHKWDSRCSDDVDDQCLRQERFNEPPRLEQRRIGPGVKDEQHHAIGGVVEDGANPKNSSEVGGYGTSR